METLRAHKGLGTKLAYTEEVCFPEDASRFRDLAEASRPCVVRRLAADWPFVEKGRLDPSVGAEIRRRIGSRTCNVSFEPGSTLFGYEVPEGWVAPAAGGGAGGGPAVEAEAPEEEGSGRKRRVPRLVNPGRLAMPFAAFLEACDRKRYGGGASSSIARVINVPYDGDEDEAEDGGSPQSLPSPHSGRGCRRARPPESPFDVPLSILERMALYCVEDAKDWPPDLLQQLVAGDPAADLMPEWVPRLEERRMWMSAGGPEGVAHVTAGFHWDQYQNIHVVLSGKKEVFLLPALQAPRLHATRFCPQAQWRLEQAEGGAERGEGRANGASARAVLKSMQSEESSSDYAVVMVDQDFAVNAARVPALVEREEEGGAKGSRWPAPSWCVLHPGDAVYIPPGWWHSIRTWRPTRVERGVPFSLSVNFWYGLTQDATLARRSELFTLQVLSCQRALVGDQRAHLAKFLRKLEQHGGREIVERLGVGLAQLPNGIGEPDFQCVD